MSLRWLTVNNRLTECIKLVNRLTKQQFAQLLEHVNKSNEFTESQLQEFEALFNLNGAQVQLLIQSVLYIWKHSTKVILKPTTLHKNLVEDLKLSEEKAEEFVKVWTERTRADCGDLENRKKLENISWELNLRTASDLNAKEKVSGVRLQLGLTDFLNSGAVENVTLDLTEEELLKLYNTLENVQNNLDKMQSASH